MDWTGYNFYYTVDENGENTSGGVIMVDPSGRRYVIPNNPKNRHWRMYQAWLADGNTTQSE